MVNVQGGAEAAVQEDVEDPVQMVFIVAPLAPAINN